MEHPGTYYVCQGAEWTCSNRVLCLIVGDRNLCQIDTEGQSHSSRFACTAPFIPGSQRAHCANRDHASHTAGQRHSAKWHLVTHPLELCAIRRCRSRRRPRIKYADPDEDDKRRHEEEAQVSAEEQELAARRLFNEAYLQRMGRPQAFGLC